MHHDDRVCQVCGGRYLGGRQCENSPRCPRGTLRQRWGPAALLAEQARWLVILQARALWRRLRRAVRGTGVAVRVLVRLLASVRLCRRRWRRRLRRLPPPEWLDGPEE